MLDPITISIVGALIKGTVTYAQEERRKERVRLEREEETKKELVRVGGQLLLMAVGAGLRALENRAKDSRLANDTRQIAVRSESKQ